MKIENYGSLLAFATGKELLLYETFGSYSGDYIAILKGENGIEIWKGTYGSCSGCDTLQAIQGYSDESPSDEQVKDYMELALHIVQGLKKMEDE